jgi:uncharacterized membrane protein
MDDKQQAQKRADQIQSFNKELKRLEAEQVLQLSAEQHAAVKHFHDSLLKSLTDQFDIDRSSRQKQLSLGMRLVSFIGALALAASVFFLFYQFWGYFGTTVQVTILVAAPLLTLVATHWVFRRESTGYFSKLLAMLGFACFALNLIMLGQIFNITPSDTILLVLAAYGIVLAYAFDVRLLLAVGILSFAGFIAARTGAWSGVYWLSVGERPEHFLLPAVLIFTVPLWLTQKRFTGFVPIYRVFGSLLFLLPVLVLSNWGEASYLPWDAAIIEGAYQVIGFVVSAALIALGIRQYWPDMANTGNGFFVLFMYTKFFDWWWEALPKYLFFLLIALVSLLLLFVYQRMRRQIRDQGVGHA